MAVLADIAYLEQWRFARATYLQQQTTCPKASNGSPSLPESRPHQTGTQKKGVIWKRTRQSHRDKQDPSQRQRKLADLDMLKLAAAAGEIELKYLDESGFCLWSPVSYTYFPRGQQKRMEQTRRRGRRLSILGLIQPLVSFVYGKSAVVVYKQVLSQNDGRPGTTGIITLS